MPSLGPFKPFLFNSYIGNNENPPITDKICWALDVRYCEASLYFFQNSIFTCHYKTKWTKTSWQREYKEKLLWKQFCFCNDRVKRQTFLHFASVYHFLIHFFSSFEISLKKTEYFFSSLLFEKSFISALRFITIFHFLDVDKIAEFRRKSSSSHERNDFFLSKKKAEKDINIWRKTTFRRNEAVNLSSLHVQQAVSC